MKEKGKACSQKGEIAVTTTNYSLQSYNEKQGDACFIFQTICGLYDKSVLILETFSFM